MKALFSKKKGALQLQPSVIGNPEKVQKYTFVVSPTDPQNELNKLGTFPEHLWELILSKVSTVGCLFTTGFVCKAFYFVAKRRVTLSPESMYGNWTFILSVRDMTSCLGRLEHFFASGNIEIKDGILRGFGVAPLGPNVHPVYAIGLCKGKTIAATSYYMPKSDPSKALFSFILVYMKFCPIAQEGILTGVSTTRINIHHTFVLTSPIVGIKTSEKYVPQEEVKFTNEKTRNHKIVLQDLPGRTKQVLGSSYSHVDFPNLVVLNLVGKWLLSFEFDQEKIELEAEANYAAQVAFGEVQSGRRGEKRDFSGVVVMSVNALGTFGLSASVRMTQAPNIILTAIVEAFESKKEIIGECVMEIGENIKTGAFVGTRI